MPPGRPPNTQPATDYDYRRYIALVQVLALGDWKGVLALCDAWDVKPEIIYPADGSRYYYDKAVTISKLAQAAIDHKEPPATDADAPA